MSTCVKSESCPDITSGGLSPVGRRPERKGGRGDDKVSLPARKKIERWIWVKIN